MSRTFFSAIALTLILLVGSPVARGVSTEDGDGSSYRTGFVRWRAADNAFAAWTLNGTRINGSGEVEFDRLTAFAETDPYGSGAYNGRSYYNGGSFFVGEATSPITTTSFHYKEAIASWNTVTPDGSWIEIQFRAQYDALWSTWYSLGIWASDSETVSRHSAGAQRDANGTVLTNTFASLNQEMDTRAFQLKLRIFSEDGLVSARVRNVFVAYSLDAPASAAVSTGNSALWNSVIRAPSCSQMVYPDGGEVWCSPTSLSMVLAYWNSDVGACEPRVRAAVDGVFDWVYDGHGNWPFNTAYAATQGYDAYVARLSSLAQAEEYIAAGVPLVGSLAWGPGQLSNAPVPSTNGHLLVLIGFDPVGNPIVNDPAAATDASVTRTYLRSEFELLWLRHSGGTVYIVHPPDHLVPSPLSS